MKKFTLLSLALLAMFTLTGCDAIETIFKAGMWWGFILVAAVIGLIFWLFSRGRK
ncbi:MULTISPECIES: phosphatidate cytidylyltransferase [Chryseobacterium group]|uniref:phosphatidate cytidylyltransferase n=1 Tax=Chryseobacterium group TaxID=2782232 RepID=UPI001A2522B8|nr:MULTISPECIES: phosphatidate cytidylyltransferase [Chryseobacterium]MBH1960765.1 phosphatidate cytidylyltransferase [Flavobacteriia bacterium]MBH2023424.1 phosphatidate cytidylyltransferase [Flavobacteriales bacterium]MCP2038388.1 putative MFS family arabinose efflux permease [Chryseobacterium sp. HSC-36S06]UFK97792.1 phosphatidate cytidylyltransferase [Chryseobacterium faecale]